MAPLMIIVVSQITAAPARDDVVEKVLYFARFKNSLELPGSEKSKAREKLYKDASEDEVVSAALAILDRPENSFLIPIILRLSSSEIYVRAMLEWVRTHLVSLCSENWRSIGDAMSLLQQFGRDEDLPMVRSALENVSATLKPDADRYVRGSLKDTILDFERYGSHDSRQRKKSSEDTPAPSKRSVEAGHSKGTDATDVVAVERNQIDSRWGTGAIVLILIGMLGGTIVFIILQRRRP